MQFSVISKTPLIVKVGMYLSPQDAVMCILSHADRTNIDYQSTALVRQLVQEKENSEFKPVKLRLKMDLVSYPARTEGLVNRINLQPQVNN